jgi:hypothetical protein
MANGDEIAVPTLWKPKNPFENVSTAQMQRCREVVKGGDFRADIQAKNWVGYMIGEVLGIDVAHGANNKPEDIARIKQIIKTWIKNGVLRVEKRSDEKSRSRSVVVPGAWSDPGLDAQDDDF